MSGRKSSRLSFRCLNRHFVRRVSFAGHEDKTDDVAEDPEPVADVNEEGVIVAEKAEDVDAEKIEGDEEDEEDEDGWDTDEFESDSDDRDEALPDKRQSRIIFDELDDIPDLVMCKIITF